jgi:mono/diheme cytochrome c family protein
MHNQWALARPASQNKKLGCYCYLTTALLLLALAGCRQDMHDQPKFYPQRSTAFYADGRSVRPQVANTIARSQGAPADYFSSGLIDGKEADGLPIPLDMATMRRGQERFNIYCTPCHSRVGDGMGMIVQRGYYPATSFHSTRLREAPLGHFFQVITNGYGIMPNYAAEIAPVDRWAIAAYIRALQLSQNAKAADIEAGHTTAKLHDILTQEGFEGSLLDTGRTSVQKSVALPTPTPLAPTQTSVQLPGSISPSTDLSAKPNPSNIPLKAVVSGKNSSASVPTQSTTDPESTKEVVKEAVAKPPVDLEEGQSIYLHNCAACHQISRAGKPPTIPTLIGIVPKVGEERIRAVLRDGMPNGKPPMPPFTRLSEEDIYNLIGFLRTDK